MRIFASRSLEKMNATMTNLSSKYPTAFKAVLLFLALYIAAAKIGNVVSIFTSPTDENVFQDSKDGVKVISIVPDGASERAGMEIGDVILSINNQAFQNAKEANAILKQTKPGDYITYVVQRGNDQLTLNVLIARVGIDWAILLSLGVMLATIAVGISVGVAKPEQQGAQMLAGSLVALAPAFAITGVGGSGVIGGLWWMSMFFGLPFAVHASLYFPKQSKNFKKQLALVRAFYIVGAATCVGLLAFDVTRTPLAMWNCAYLSIAIGILYGIKRLQEPDIQKAQRWIFYALIVFGVSNGTGWWLYNEFGKVALYVLLLAAVVPAAYFYSITKYRFFGITRIVKRSLSYHVTNAAIMFFLIVAFINVVSWLTRLEWTTPVGVRFTTMSIQIFTGSENPAANKIGERFIFILFGIGVMWAFKLLSEKVRDLLDAYFHRRKYNYRDALSEISEVLAEKITVSELAESITDEIIELMQLKGAAICLAVRNGYRLETAKGSCAVLTADDAEELYRRGSELLLPVPIVDLLLPNEMPLDARNQMSRIQEAGVQLVAPLVIKDKSIGIILLAEKRSEETYKEDDVKFIESVARQAAVAFENARLNKEESEKRRLKRELEFARKVQQEILPQEIPAMKGLVVAGSYIAAGEVGGDYYDVILESSRHAKPSLAQHLTVLVGDVAGKGISAAMYMARVQGIMRTLNYGGTLSPKALLEQANAVLFSRDMRRSFVTMFCGQFDTEQKTLVVARAGHLPMLWYSTADDRWHIVKPSGMGIGLDAGERFANALAEEKLCYREGDVFIFFSDGVTEAKNSNGDEFGMERLLELIERDKHQPASEMLGRIENALIDFVGNAEQHDDITLLIVKAEPVEVRPENSIDHCEHDAENAKLVC